MNDAVDGAVRVVANRVVAFFGKVQEFGRIRHELPGNGILRVAVVDQPGNRWRDGERVTLRHRAQVLQRFGFNQPRFEKRFGCLDGLKPCHRPYSATGAHMTRSIRGAPVASITSRSKPSAMPLAGGMIASAARKSSSSG
ncbi:hypothetical protein D3C80_594190 [compost metagenome]